MIKPFAYNILSNKTCIDCGKQLKANLIASNPEANRCYRHHIKAKGSESRREFHK